METSGSGVLPRILALLLICGNTGASAAVSDMNLTCTNDYAEMVCRFHSPLDCSNYTMKVFSLVDPESISPCHPERCPGGSCCCRPGGVLLVIGEVHAASVLKGGRRVASQNFSVINNLIPKTPTIVSVNESNGNFQLMWTSNYGLRRRTFRESLEAIVTYREKGSNEEHSSQPLAPSSDRSGKLSWYTIPGQDLKPSTTYFVSVRTYLPLNGRYSDSSQELEFKTAASHLFLLLAVILGLSLVAALTSAFIYVCYIRLKSKWWDSVSDYQNPKLLTINPNKQEILKLVPPIVSPICVESPGLVDGKLWSKGSYTGSSSSHESLVESSGISTGSSSLSYAKTEPADVIAGVQEALSKAFNISPGLTGICSPLTQSNPVGADAPSSVRPEGWSSGSSGFDNKTYAIVITNESGAGKAPESVRGPSEGGVLPLPDEQPSACAFPACQDAILLPGVLSCEQTNTDMPYQKSGDSGFVYTSNSSLSSSSSGINTTTEEVKCEEGAVCDKNPCYGPLPTGSRGFPPVEDDYQAFQSLVEQPPVSFSEQRDGEQEFSHMGSSSTIPPSQAGEFPPAFQGPLLSFMSANQAPSIIVDSGYQCV